MIVLRPTYKSTTIDLEENMMDKLDKASKDLGVPKVRIIRLCIENELPKLISRETKRIKRQKN